MIKLNTPLATALAGFVSFREILRQSPGSMLHLYSGAQPSYADSLYMTGTELSFIATKQVQCTGHHISFEFHEGRVINTGTVGWFRLTLAPEYWLDGSCGTSGKDLNFGSSTLTENNNLYIASFVLNFEDSGTHETIALPSLIVGSEWQGPPAPKLYPPERGKDIFW